MTNSNRSTSLLGNAFVALVTFLLCIDFSKSNIITLSQIPVLSFVFHLLGNNRLLILTVAFFLISCLIKVPVINRNFASKIWITFGIASISILISGSINVSSGTIAYDILLMLVACCIISIRLTEYGQTAENVILLWGYFEGILGIIQYFKRTTIFSPYYNGKPYLNTIFYLDGFSSNNPVYLSLGAQVRSFGTMDSGLSFGIFMLLCVAIVLARTTFSRFGKMVRLVFFFTAIFGTITRNVFIGMATLILLWLFNDFFYKRRRILKTLYIVFLFIEMFTPWIGTIISFLGKLSTLLNIPTLLDRFSFLTTTLRQIRGLTDFLWGRQIVSSFQVPIDNVFVASLLKNGAIFGLAFILMYYFAFSQLLWNVQKKDLFKLDFLLILPLLGTFNNIYIATAMGTALIMMSVPAPSSSDINAIHIPYSLVTY